MNYAEKRMGTSLRKLMKDKKLGAGKSDLLAGINTAQRLTGNKTVKFQNYYGRPVRGNIGDVKAMKKAI